MLITDEGLNAIEQAAEKKRSADTLLLVQVLKEVRQVAALLKQQNDARNCGRNGADSPDNGNDAEE